MSGRVSPWGCHTPSSAVSGLMDLAASISAGHTQMPVWSLCEPSPVGSRQRVAESLGLGARHIGILVPSVPSPGPVTTSEMLTPQDPVSTSVKGVITSLTWRGYPEAWMREREWVEHGGARGWEHPLVHVKGRSTNRNGTHGARAGALT